MLISLTMINLWISSLSFRRTTFRSLYQTCRVHSTDDHSYSTQHISPILHGNDSRLWNDRVWVEKGKVYFVATPLGNMADISRRAELVLRQVDVICAEDTRVTINLLRKLQIPHKQLLSHHEHNQRESILKVLSLLHENLSLAIVSDAGTPGVSDPGASLASALAVEGVQTVPVPGPSALAAALSICGFPGSPSSFLSFLPVKGTSRLETIESLFRLPLSSHTIVLFEAPHRLLRTITDLAQTEEKYYTKLRPIVICRELTKRHEEILRYSSLMAARQGVHERWNQEDGEREPKGEFTLVLGPTISNTNNNSNNNNDSTENELKSTLEGLRYEGLKRSAAAREAAELLNIPRSKVYDAALAMDWSSDEEKKKVSQTTTAQAEEMKPTDNKATSIFRRRRVRKDID